MLFLLDIVFVDANFIKIVEFIFYNTFFFIYELLGLFGIYCPIVPSKDKMDFGQAPLDSIFGVIF